MNEIEILIYISICFCLIGLIIFLILPKSIFKDLLINYIKKILRFFINWKFLVCFLISWMITNGWCYLFILFGGIFKIVWMRNIGLAYAAILWFPATPEKIITVAIAVVIRKLFFPKDKELEKLIEEEKTNIKHGK